MACIATEPIDEFAVSEEFSIMSVDDAKEKLSDDRRVGDDKISESAAPIAVMATANDSGSSNKPTEIKAKSNWEQEISDDFSIQSKTTSGNKHRMPSSSHSSSVDGARHRNTVEASSVSSVGRKPPSTSFEVPREVTQDVRELNDVEVSEGFGMSLSSSLRSGGSRVMADASYSLASDVPPSAMHKLSNIHR
jgi:hypothetical protein